MEIYQFVRNILFISFCFSLFYCLYVNIFIFNKDWAVQNQKLEAVSFLLENYEVDVLQKNSFGRSVLTDAFQTGNTDIIGLCLSHSSSSEERLIDVDNGSTTTKSGNNNSNEESKSFTESHEDNNNNNNNDNNNNNQNNENRGNEVIHEFDMTPLVSQLVDDNSSTTQIESVETRQRKVLKVRELPITHADNPFGGISTPEDDTTGLFKIISLLFLFIFILLFILLLF